MTMPEGARLKRVQHVENGLSITHGTTVSRADEVWIYGTEGEVVAKVYRSGLVETRAEIVLVTHSRNLTPEGATP